MTTTTCIAITTTCRVSLLLLASLAPHYLTCFCRVPLSSDTPAEHPAVEPEQD